MDGSAPQPMQPDEIIEMVQESKETIEKAVGGTFNGITADQTGEPTNKDPDNSNSSEQRETATDGNKDKGMSIWIAAGVGGLVVLLIVLVAFGICQLRRKRRLNKRRADNIRGNTHTNTEFGNPAFDGDSIYDSISKARGSSLASDQPQANDDVFQELRFQNDKPQARNDAAFDSRTYQALDKAAMTRPASATAQHNTFSGGRSIENPSYANLQANKEQGANKYPGRGMNDPEKRYAALHRKKGQPRQGGEAAQSKKGINQPATSAAKDEDIYVDLTCHEESGA